MNRHVRKFWLALTDILGAPNREVKRFQKRRAQRRWAEQIKQPIRVSANPHSQIMLCRDDGSPVMVLTLASVHYSSYPGDRSAEYVDSMRWMVRG